MKITIIGTAYPYRGGLASFNERLAQGLIALGHDVNIETFTLQYPSFLFPGKTQFSNEKGPEHLRIKQSINSVNPLNWLTVGNRIKKEKPDLVVIKYWLPFMGPAFGTLLSRIRSNKHTQVISILDNLIPHEKRIGDKIFTKYFISKVDAFVAMSREVLQDLHSFTTKVPSQFLPHPVYDNYGDPISRDEARSTLQLEKEGKYILFFGFIRKYKGLDLLFQAMQDARIRSAGIKLIVAGEYYGDEDFYLQKIKELNIEDNLKLFTDFILNDEVKNYFSAADLVVQPYRTATQSGISQLAYHFEKPMIVTNVGGLPEIVPHEKVGYVVAPNPQEIADAILRFYDEKDKLNFAENIKIEKEKYSWDYFIDEMLKLTQSQ